MSEVIHVDTIIFGSSGLTGSYLKTYLQEDSNITAILDVGRRVPDTVSDKVTYENLSILEENQSSTQKYAAETCFLCLGTTIKKAGSQANFEKIDKDLMIKAAQFALASGVKKLIMISAIGANSSSMVHYSKVKGQTEEIIGAMPFEECHIFRPSLLLGQRVEKRTAERLSIKLYQLLEPFLAQWLGNYRPIPAWQLAKAMLACIKLKSEPFTKCRIYYYKNIKQLLSI
jgi:hypothetical protein